jgi:hypothetical protein
MVLMQMTTLNGQFEFSKWYEYIFAKLGILCRNDLMFINIVIGIFQFLEYNYLYVSFKVFV